MWFLQLNSLLSKGSFPGYSSDARDSWERLHGGTAGAECQHQGPSIKICAFMYVCMYVCMYVYKYIFCFLSVCINFQVLQNHHISIYIYIHIYIYRYIYTLSSNYIYVCGCAWRCETPKPGFSTWLMHLFPCTRYVGTRTHRIISKYTCIYEYIHVYAKCIDLYIYIYIKFIYKYIYLSINI